MIKDDMKHCSNCNLGLEGKCELELEESCVTNTGNEEHGDFWICCADIQDQIDLQHKLQKLGYNIVTCGNCGTVLIHETPLPLEYHDELTCYACGLQSDPSDFPDIYYEGCYDPSKN